MSKGLFLWAIFATIIAVFFIWKYEQKSCIENVVNNIVDTAVIYIPMQGGTMNNPAYNPFTLPSLQQNQRNIMITPTVSFNPVKGISYGVGVTYLKPKWSLGYHYDFVRDRHTIGMGWRF